MARELLDVAECGVQRSRQSTEACCPRRRMRAVPGPTRNATRLNESPRHFHGDTSGSAKDVLESPTCHAPDPMSSLTRYATMKRSGSPNGHGLTSSTPEEFLDEQASLARESLRTTASHAAADVVSLLDPRPWTRRFPKSATLVGVSAGLLSGFSTTWLLVRRKGKVQDGKDRAESEVAGVRVRAVKGDVEESVAAGARVGAREGERSWPVAMLLTLGKLALPVALRAVNPPRTRVANVSLDDALERSTVMTRRRALPGRGPAQTAWILVKRTFSEFLGDNSFRNAAALSYYTVFSLAPLLVIATAVAGLLLTQEDVKASVLAEIESLIGPKGREFVASGLEQVQSIGKSVWATALGIGVLLFGASGVFYQLKQALNAMWGVPVESRGGVFRALRDRFLSFALVLGLGFLLLVSLLVNAVLHGFDNWLTSRLSFPPLVLQILNGTLGFLVITVLFSMIYKWLPDVTLTWKEVGFGALVTSTLFVAGKFVIGFYLGNAAISSTYGAAASVIVILLWANYSALTFLLGAEFTFVYATLTRPDKAEPRRDYKRLQAQDRK